MYFVTSMSEELQVGPRKFVIAFFGKDSLHHCLCCNLAKLLCLFIHTVGEQTQLSLKHNNGYKEFNLTGHNFIIFCINDKEHCSSGNVVGVLLGNTLRIWQMLDLYRQKCTVAQGWGACWPLRTVDFGKQPQLVILSVFCGFFFFFLRRGKTLASN